jgi:hopanoid biosynthesis associated RND transporter like protein HpnN
MLKSPLVRLVDLSTQFAWVVIVVALGLTGFCAAYAVRNFSVATDVRQLFPAHLPWAERANSFMTTFPQYEVLVVVEAPTPELAEQASASLSSALKADREHIRAVEEPQGDKFLVRNGLLFLPSDQLARTSAMMERSRPMLAQLAADPSLRGILNTLSAGLMGVANHAYSLDALAPAMNAGADTVDDALAGRAAHFSWRSLLGDSSNQGGKRRFIEVAPVLQFNALQPGRAATDAIYGAARRLDLAHDDQARVQVTGLVPMDDAQFATLKENAALNAAISIVAVLIILWLALHSWRIMFAVAVSVACGLAMTAALGLFIVGSLNLISVAFFVLFVGLAVDFGIQFSVRYRAERHEIGELRPALVAAAKKAGWPLALAAAATALGFSAFLPTEYRGLSELGRIAGPGMIIAFLMSITLLPALLRVLNPPGEPRAMGFIALAPVDHFLRRHRFAVLVGTLAVVGLAAPLLTRLRFDFNTLHMENPHAPAVATFLALRKDPATAASAAEIIAPNLAAAKADARRVAALPTVSSTRTLANLIPDDQQRKLFLIHKMAQAIGPALNPPRLRPPPTDQENVVALRATTQMLTRMTAQGGAGGKAATRLSGLLDKLAAADVSARERVSAAMVVPLEISLDDLRQSLKARTVTAQRIPDDLKRDWLAPDGRARVEILPKGDPDDTAALRNFVAAVLAVAPSATGPAVMLYEAGNTIVRAFIEAGIFAVAAIALLLWIALRRLRDMLLTLIPLLLAAMLTLELCVLFGIQLNFTNIIAFPLLLGVGVAFKIYYIMAWRRGGTALVQSTLTRAVIFSAMTTATAFGTLWLSHHPGTSSMGQLMALALVCTMMAAVLFQPVLMGPPREVAQTQLGAMPGPVRRTASRTRAIEHAHEHGV